MDLVDFWGGCANILERIGLMYGYGYEYECG